MSDRGEFEASTADRFPGLDLSLDAEGDYDDLDAQQHWGTWQASRQAIKGEAVGVAQPYAPNPGMTQCVFTAKAVPVGAKLYTQPASGDVPKVGPDDIHQWAGSILAKEWSEDAPSDRALNLAHRIVGLTTASADVKEVIKSLSDKLEAVESEESIAYVSGWNDCWEKAKYCVKDDRSHGLRPGFGAVIC